MPLPSRAPYCAFLKYSSSGTSPASVASKTFTHRIKNDGPAPHDPTVRAIDFAASRLSALVPAHDCLAHCFGPDVTLVPVPRSAPLTSGALWPAMRLCESMRLKRLALDVRPLLVRTRAVTKSATARTAGRPSPVEHYESIKAESAGMVAPARITIVDDVVTRGATLLACLGRLQEAYPDTPITCFALIRTMSYGVEVEHMLDPVKGLLTSVPHRDP